MSPIARTLSERMNENKSLKIRCFFNTIEKLNAVISQLIQGPAKGPEEQTVGTRNDTQVFPTEQLLLTERSKPFEMPSFRRPSLWVVKNLQLLEKFPTRLFSELQLLRDLDADGMIWALP